MSEVRNIIKAVLVGETGIGKTCIIQRLCFGEYKENPESTIGSATDKKILDYGQEKLTLEIWDTAGQEVYRSLNRIFYKDAKIVVLVYDITNRVTFEEIKKYWFNQVRTICGEEAVIGIAGNKCDLFVEEQVPEEEAKKFAEDNGCIFMQISALNGVGVEDLFMELGKKFLQDPSIAKQKKSGFQIKDNKESKGNGKEESKCCN